jgi:HEAT repeat protein
VKSLSDPDRFVRWAAVRTLGRLAPREANLVVPAVARLLEDGDLDVEVAAATALERYGPQATDAVTALAQRSTHGDAEIRIAAMRVLVAIGNDAAPALPSVARNLVTQLAGISADFDLLQPGRTTPGAERAALSAAATLLGAPQPARIRVTAAETLGRFGKLAAAAAPVLQQALSDIDPDVRRAASEALLKITSK